MNLLKDTYHGVYINLSKSKDRLKYISSHLKDLQIDNFFQRFDAIDGSDYALVKTEKFIGLLLILLKLKILVKMYQFVKIKIE